MQLRILNLLASIVVLTLLAMLAAPALYLQGTVKAAVLAAILFIGAAAWILHAFHLVVEQTDKDLVEENRRRGL